MNQESLPLLRPRALKKGATLGVYTPSSPSYQDNPGLFENGLKTLEILGFKIKLGSLTSQRSSQGYRSGNPEQRAAEFMELISDPQVEGLISTIGGNNSSSLIPYLDFEKIREVRKPICGFSDVTSLHLAILKYAGLRTVYSPSVMCWFGEWPQGIPESSQWFLDAVVNHTTGARELVPPIQWSNHSRNWANGDWKNLPRQWKPNEGWKVLNAGVAEAPALVANMNTLVTAAGTAYWPDLKGKILLLEDMWAPQSRNERLLRQLSLMGVFEQIAGLIIGKPEVYDQERAPFTYDELFMEVVGKRNYPIVSNFDCSHTVPMISLIQQTPMRITATGEFAKVMLLDGGIE
ncbi:MAG: LD-carboxypeptidase [Bdellovibrio sp.]